MLTAGGEAVDQSMAAEFWRAIVVGDRERARAAGSSLIDVPLVAIPSFSFPESPSSGGSGLAAAERAAQAGGSILSPKNVQPDTPAATIDAWNATKHVTLTVISRDTICGARTVTEGETDFMACGLLKGVCATFTHKGKDSKNKPTVYVDFPPTGEALAISVRASSQSTKPKFFSTPLLWLEAIPEEFRDEGRMEILTSLSFFAKTWKVLLEAYEGPQWMTDLVFGSGSAKLPPQEPFRSGPPPGIDIPSPRVGEGGYRASDFVEDASLSQQGSARRAPGGSSQSKDYAGDSEDDDDENSLAAPAPPPTYEDAFDPIMRQIGGSRTAGTTFNPSAYSYRMGTGSEASLPCSLGSDGVTRMQEKLVKLKSRVLVLEEELRNRDISLKATFERIRGEMDSLWKMEDERNRRLASTPSPTIAGPTMDHVANAISNDRAFRHRVAKSVLESMDANTFVTEAELEHRLARAPPEPAEPSLSTFDISSRINKIEDALFRPEGPVALLFAKVKFLEERRIGQAVERGGRIFKDQKAVEAFVLASGDNDIYRYAVDMVSLIMLTQDPFTTVAEGMATEAAAFKAQYNSLLEARLSISYKITYPENIMKRVDKKEAATTEGWVWTGPWATFEVFEGNYNNGALHRMKTDLRDARDMIKNAVEFAFPLETKPDLRAIFLEQLGKSYEQAIGWLESLAPLYKTMQTAGLSAAEAWDRVLVYTKTLLDDVKTVRQLSAEKSASAMIWGSFRATELLEEYLRLRFIQHPQVSSILALTSMQREGKSLNDAVASLASEGKAIKTHASQIKTLQEQINTLKHNNPSLK